MIKLKISDLLGKYKKSQRWLSLSTNIRPNTMSNYYHEKVQLININDLNNIIKTFKSIDESFVITDLIEYIPDKDSQSNN